MKINGNIVSCAGNFALRARCKVARGISLDIRHMPGLTHENLYSSKNNHYRKKSAALPAAALPFARGTSRSALVASAAADRDWNRTAQNFFEILLAIGQSGSAALPLPRVPPFFLYYVSFLCIHFSCGIPAAHATSR